MQDPIGTLTIALVSAVAIVAAAILGTRQAAKINAEASHSIARLNAQTTKDVEEIKARAQRMLERDKDHRQWRRERAQPMVAHLAEISQLSQAAMSLDGKCWEDARGVLEKLEVALRAQPTRDLLLGSIPTDLRERVTILYARERGWVESFSEWFVAGNAADVAISLVPRPEWVQYMTAAQDTRSEVHQGLENFVYSIAD